MITLRGFLFLVIGVGFTLVASQVLEGADWQLILGWVLAIVGAVGLGLLEWRGIA